MRIEYVTFYTLQYINMAPPPDLRNLGEGNGWITDGFPTTYDQAKLLEIHLTGFDVDSNGPVRQVTSVHAAYRGQLDRLLVSVWRIEAS